MQATNNPAGCLLPAASANPHGGRFHTRRSRPWSPQCPRCRPTSSTGSPALDQSSFVRSPVRGRWRLPVHALEVRELAHGPAGPARGTRLVPVMAMSVHTESHLSSSCPLETSGVPGSPPGPRGGRTALPAGCWSAASGARFGWPVAAMAQGRRQRTPGQLLAKAPAQARTAAASGHAAPAPGPGTLRVT